MAGLAWLGMAALLEREQRLDIRCEAEADLT